MLGQTAPKFGEARSYSKYVFMNFTTLFFFYKQFSFLIRPKIV